MKLHPRHLTLTLVAVLVSSATATVRYVDLSNFSPAPPYTNWAGAAVTIQQAVDAASAGDEIVVTNGTYATGGQIIYGAMSNRVAVTKPVIVRSVNGPASTTIIGSGAIRAVYLTNGAFLSGFTLTGGATLTSGDAYREQSGGALWCESTNAVASNCVLQANSAHWYGGGAYGGTLLGCTLTANSSVLSSGGGACSNALINCILSGNSSGNMGGGGYGCVLSGCTLSGNSAANYGGGTCYCNLTNCTLSGNSSATGGGDAYSTLNNCLLKGNSTGTGNGGGAYSSTLNNCTLTSNSTMANGAGVCGGTLNNCALNGNSTSGEYGGRGGGAAGATLRNCTLTGNYAANGGGASGCTLTNCILYGNVGSGSANYDTSSTLNYCCSTPLPSSGVGNFDAEPQLASSSHVSASSPCLGRGSYLATTGTDIDGAPWANPPAIGCDEQRTGLAAGPLTVTIGTSYPLYSYTKVAVGFSMELQALISGPVTASRWEFGDGTVTSNRPYASHCWSAAGDYSIALRAYNQTYPSGLAATVTVHVVTQAVHYVALGNPAPVAPYSTWATAATNIQNAVDVATVTGALVLVSNGVYQTGSRSVSGSMYNRVAVTKPLVVSSVNGANSTVIKGNRVLGNSAVRCVYLASGACLTGFTLTNGATLTSGYLFQLISGGGVWCQSNNCVVSDCIITANSASACGGGAFGGTLTNCTVSSNGAGAAGGGACCGIVNNCPLNNNSANIGGGAYGCTLSICTLISNSVSGTGGGTDSSTLNNCTLTGNSATSSTSGGGGANASALNNCVVSGNKAYLGGGTYSCKLRNCTLTGNSASKYGGDMNSELNNCILYFNTATNVVPDYGGSVEKLSYCCTTPTPIDGIGNITSPPLFVDQAGGDFRLQSDSPCINAGNNACVSASTDLDGNPRIAGSTVDIGAYEYQSPASVLSYAWAQQYGLPTDGSQDFADLDGDGFNNWQEWMAGTLPNSAASALRVLPLTRNSSGVVVTWQSISNQAYCVERSMRLGSHPAFYTLATSIAGQPDWTSYTDTTAAGPGPFFYRVAVMTSSYQAQLPGSIIPLAWLQQYGLPMDGSADFLDSDGDGMSNWAEWRAGTNPTDPSSALRMMSATKAASGLNVTWQSVSNRSYYLERATDLSSASPFQSQATGIPGAADYTTYTDTTATNGGPYFYRIGVQ